MEGACVCVYVMEGKKLKLAKGKDFGLAFLSLCSIHPSSLSLSRVSSSFLVSVDFFRKLWKKEKSREERTKRKERREKKEMIRLLDLTKT